MGRTWAEKINAAVDIITNLDFDNLEVDEAYDEERDLVFFKEPDQAANIILTDGGYAILYPADSHKPGLRVGEEPVAVRKIVGKVRV